MKLLASRMSARLLFWMAFFSPTLLTLMHSGSGGNWKSLVWAAAASAILSVLTSRIFIIVQWIALAALPLWWWWLGYAAMNGVGPGWDAAMAALSSNPGEALSALRLAISTPGFLGFAAFCSLCLLGSIVVQFRARQHSVPHDVSKKALQGVLGASLMLFAVSAISEATRVMTFAPFQSADASFSPLGTITRLMLEEGSRVLYGSPRRVAIRRPAHAPHHATKPILAIFVVGESMRAGGIGPQKTSRGQWTSALDQRIRAGLGVWLPPVCANSFSTLISFSMLLTATSPERHDDADSAPSVIAILKDAGFSTAWIVNQDASVFQEDGHDLDWAVSEVSYSAGAFDEEMIRVASAFAGPLTETSPGLLTPRAMMLHMHGSHFEYVDRYPSNLFPPEPANLPQDDLTELRYERSEEYSAKVLVGLADLLDRSTVPAFMVFTSDHGENLPRDRNGLRTHLGARASIHDGTVPAVVLWNRAMGQTGRTEQVLRLLEKPQMIAHVDVSKAFLALAGMMDGPVVPEQDPKIVAPVKVGDSGNTVNSCSLLKP